MAALTALGLVQAGHGGLNPGTLAERLGTAQATLSFHLKELQHAGLIRARRESRFIYYTADFAAMGELLSFLTENCCGSTEEISAAVPSPLPEEASS